MERDAWGKAGQGSRAAPSRLGRWHGAARAGGLSFLEECGVHLMRSPPRRQLPWPWRLPFRFLLLPDTLASGCALFPPGRGQAAIPFLLGTASLDQSSHGTYQSTHMYTHTRARSVCLGGEDAAGLLGCGWGPELTVSERIEIPSEFHHHHCHRGFSRRWARKPRRGGPASPLASARCSLFRRSRGPIGQGEDVGLRPVPSSLGPCQETAVRPARGGGGKFGCCVPGFIPVEIFALERVGRGESFPGASVGRVLSGCMALGGRELGLLSWVVSRPPGFPDGCWAAAAEGSVWVGWASRGEGKCPCCSFPPTCWVTREICEAWLTSAPAAC